MHQGRSVRDNGETVLSSGARPEPLRSQVVTLGFLSETISASFISEQLAGSLRAETGASVVLVRLEPQEGTGNSTDGERPEVSLNGEFHLPSHVRKSEAGFYSLTLGVGAEPPTGAGIASLASHLSRDFRYVLIQTQVNEEPAPWHFELVLRSDLTYLFFKAGTEDVYHLDRVLRGARGRTESARVKPIACLAEGEQADGFDLLAERLACPVHLFVRGCPALRAGKEAAPQTSPMGLFLGDVRRLAREIGGRLVGLALSSGAAKGFAHVGVIQVLEENGIEVDVVAGASMGAYVGALWAYGLDGRELERLARELESRRALWSLIDPALPPRRGFLRGFAVKKRLMRSIGQARFADLVRPLRIVAANLATLERVVFSSGEVAAAVHASIAVPGICVPIALNGQTYVDGGIVDPLPVDILREMGIPRVIAVNVIPTPDRIRYGIETELELARHNSTKGRKWFGRAPALNQQVNYFARGNLLEILMRSVHGAQIRMAEASCPLADLVLRPDIYDDRWLDYGDPGKFIALGRKVAERHIEEIKSLVSRKEPIHEPNPAPGPVATIV